LGDPLLLNVVMITGRDMDIKWMNDTFITK